MRSSIGSRHEGGHRRHRGLVGRAARAQVRAGRPAGGLRRADRRRPASPTRRGGAAGRAAARPDGPERRRGRGQGRARARLRAPRAARLPPARRRPPPRALGRPRGAPQPALDRRALRLRRPPLRPARGRRRAHRRQRRRRARPGRVAPARRLRDRAGPGRRGGAADAARGAAPRGRRRRAGTGGDPAGPRRARGGGAVSERPSVLLVDDRRENLIALEAVLQPLDCRLVSVTSGEAALRRLLHEDFAVILLDVQMPVLDGFETAQYIKRRERTRNIPILFVTAISKDRAHVFRGYEAGAVDYVFKPYEPEVLRAKVAVFLRLHATSRALARSEAVLRAAFECAPIGMGRLDAEGRVLEANPALARTVERDAAWLEGRNLRSLVHAEDADADAGDRAALLAGLRGSYDVELRLLTPAGDEVPCLCSFSAAQVAGEPDALVVQIQDLRDRKRAEAEREALVREQAARAEAERVAGRLEAVARLADAALGSASVQDIVQELLLGVGEVMAADTAAIVLTGRGGEQPMLHHVDGSVRATLRSMRWTPPEEGPAARALAGMTVVVDDVGLEAAGAHPLSERVRSLLAVPLRGDGEVVGALLAGSLFARTFGVEDLSVLALAADRAGLAIQRMRLYEQEHAIATRLQRSLLPRELARIPGVATAARYSPGGAGTQVGGDWYDAIGLGDGRLLLVMGDVAGRGGEAAWVMVQMRSGNRAYTLIGGGAANMPLRANA